MIPTNFSGSAQIKQLADALPNAAIRPIGHSENPERPAQFHACGSSQTDRIERSAHEALYRLAQGLRNPHSWQSDAGFRLHQKIQVPYRQANGHSPYKLRPELAHSRAVLTPPLH